MHFTVYRLDFSTRLVLRYLKRLLQKNWLKQTAMRDLAAQNSCWVMLSSFVSVIESYLHRKNWQNDWLHVSAAAKKRQTKTPFLTRTTFNQLLKVTEGVSKLGYTSVIFVDLGVEVDGTYYCDFSCHSCCLSFHHDSASEYRACYFSGVNILL